MCSKIVKFLYLLKTVSGLQLDVMFVSKWPSFLMDRKNYLWSTYMFSCLQTFQIQRGSGRRWDQ